MKSVLMMNYNISASFKFLGEGEVLLNLIFWDFIYTFVPILLPLTMHDIPIIENVCILTVWFFHELVTEVFVSDLN